ncbi:hypothetical protein SMD22_20795 [Brevibacillus halotolerans]|uniref:hypothetical protein n=1 Tax=Brevibacillus TaxID=55080 RepID=UPI000839C0AB|nr:MULTISPECIES: hypothetical protein [Brevibacillus]WPS86913.1 hypothetical protein SMD22_20795 [Brevibacillus halotolerans]
MKRKILPHLVLTTAILGSLVMVSAPSTHAEKGVEKIPDQMLAGTIIEYDDSYNMVVIEKGEKLTSNEKVQAVQTQELSNTELIKLTEEETLVQKILDEAKELPVYHIQNPAPQPGMRVIYDGEGFIKKIVYPSSIKEDDGVEALAYKALPRGTRKAAGTYKYGANNNTIVITGSSSGSVLGTGRFTNFTDTTGENDNKLVKGDCATRGDIDNPKYNTTINARNTENDKAAAVTKRDNGALPDAVLDIWKTGVEDFGLKWDKNLSFKGRYYYEF